MANYPTVPSWRMATDKDGTVMVTINPDNTIEQWTAAQVISGNDESETNAMGSTQYRKAYCAIFPELRDIDGYFFRGGSESGDYVVEVSADTTNGVDGTWTQVGTYLNSDYRSGQVVPDYRSKITSATVLAVRGIRLRMAANMIYGCRAFHLYGEIAPNQNTERLALWHPTLDQHITPGYFDWGDVQRSSSADRQFRIKNLATAQTANSIRVAMDVLTDFTPSVPGQHTLSADGATFVAQVNIGNLAPGAISGVLTLRRNTPSNANLGLAAMRVFAEANNWS